MKKKLICLLVAGALPGVALADSTSAQLKALQAQVAALQQQMKAMQAQLAAAGARRSHRQAPAASRPRPWPPTPVRPTTARRPRC